MLEGENLAEILRHAVQAGFAISRAQLERWRNRGLLPKVRQVGLGRGAGSQVVYPTGSASQAVAIARLLAEKEKFEVVGWRLWMMGYEVEERYWRPHLIQVTLQFRNFLAALIRIERKYELENFTIYDKIVGIIQNYGKINLSFSRIKNEIRVFILSTIMSVAKGEFYGFDNREDTSLQNDISFLIAALGVPSSGPMHDIARDVGFFRLIENVLINISQAFFIIRENKNIDVIDIDTRFSFEIAKSIISKMLISFSVFPGGKRSFLSVTKNILEDDNLVMQAGMLMLWHYLICQGRILPNNELSNLRELLNAFTDPKG